MLKYNISTNLITSLDYFILEYLGNTRYNIFLKKKKKLK